jgi:hypothetical protein
LSFINIVKFTFEVSDYKRYWLVDYIFGKRKVVHVSTITYNYYFSS